MSCRISFSNEIHSGANPESMSTLLSLRVVESTSRKKSNRNYYFHTQPAYELLFSSGLLLKRFPGANHKIKQHQYCY